MTPTVEAWVCARPGAPLLDAVLRALRDAGAEPRIAHAPPRQGPAAARNEALAACRADVLALVEDDVAVVPGWLDALVAAWSRDDAAPRAVLGGPLGAAFPDGRPRWLGDGMLATLGVDERAPAPEARAGEPVPLDPEAWTFHGGNVSFRTEALRGVGGFWPARGRPGLHDWFGEEHHAQRELARAGWGAAWVPGARAARLVDAARLRPAGVVAARAHTGSRSTQVGLPRPRALAARTAASAAAGVPVALARGERATAVERAARAAENAGVLAGPLVGHPDLQPAAGRTPFRHSIPAAQPGPAVAALRRMRAGARARRRGRQSAPLVLLYHRVVAGRPDPLGLAVAPERLAAQLDVLTARRTVVALDAIVAGDAPPDAVALTFDDGYADVLQHGLPALEAAGLPATVFASTGHVEHGTAFWWDALERVFASARPDAGPLRLDLGGDGRAWPAATPEQREAARVHLRRWLQGLPPDAVDAALAALGAWAGVPDPAAPPPGDRAMTVDELRRLAASPLVTLGSHTRRHANLAALDPAARAAELGRARDDLAAWVGTAPDGVAYPYGVPGVDVDEGTRIAAREAGHAFGLVNAPGRLDAGTDRFALPRHAVPDLGADGFDAWLSGAMRAAA